MKNLLLSSYQNIKNVFKFCILFTIKIYQVFISSFSMSRCRYIPTCSCYAGESIEKFGVLKGMYLTVFRIVRCHPFSVGGVDSVPEQFLFFMRGQSDK